MFSVPSDLVPNFKRLIESIVALITDTAPPVDPDPDPIDPPVPGDSEMQYRPETDDFVWTHKGEEIRITNFTYAGVPGGIPALPAVPDLSVSPNNREDILSALEELDKLRADSNQIMYLRIDKDVQISSGIGVPDNTVIYGAEGKVKITPTGGGNPAFYFGGDWTRNGRVTLKVQPKRGSKVLDFSGTSFDPKPGQTIYTEIRKVPKYLERKFWPWPYTGEFAQEYQRCFYLIESVDGKKATLAAPILDDVESHQEFLVGPGWGVKNSGVANMVFDHNKIQANGIVFNAATRCWASDINLLAPYSHPIHCPRPGAFQCQVRNIYSEKPKM